MKRRRIRAKVYGTADCPRLAFFRSNKNVYAQIINDDEGKTFVGVSSLKSEKKGAVDCAGEMGADIAQRAKKAGIERVVFDRGGFMYLGSVKTFADAARAGGLQF